MHKWLNRELGESNQIMNADLLCKLRVQINILFTLLMINNNQIQDYFKEALVRAQSQSRPFQPSSILPFSTSSPVSPKTQRGQCPSAPQCPRSSQVPDSPSSATPLRHLCPLSLCQYGHGSKPCLLCLVSRQELKFHITAENET